jgi:hypothetical protein
MKNIFLFSLFFISVYAIGQDKEVSVSDFNFESTTNPAFTLLEETPSQLNMPNNIKSLALYLSNGFSNTNIALEVNPYWFFDSDKKRSYSRYRGIQTKMRNGVEEQVIDPFKGIETGTSISLAYLNKKFEGLSEEKQVIAIGARTSIIKLYNAERRNKILDVIIEISRDPEIGINKEFKAYLSAWTELTLPDNSDCGLEVSDSQLKDYLKAALDYLNTADAKTYLETYNIRDMTKEKLLKGYLDERCTIVNAFVNNEKEIKPNLRLDGALAYSYLFKNKDFNGATANRLASWLTVDAAIRFNDKRYLHFLALAKYVDDGFNENASGGYFSENFLDYGGKLEIELNNFKLSYEYLRRSGNVKKFRSVGNITYQLSKTMSITGGFGKDFPVDDNLVSILGINWGLNTGEKSFTQK